MKSFVLAFLSLSLSLSLLAQPANLLQNLLSNKTGTSYRISTDYDTVNAQSGAKTIYLTLPDNKDSLMYGGDWTGMLWFEFDTLALNADDHDIDIYIEESVTAGIIVVAGDTLGTGATNWRTAYEPDFTAAEITTTPSHVANAGVHLAWVNRGLRTRLKVVVTDGVIRWRTDALIKRSNDPRY